MKTLEGSFVAARAPFEESYFTRRGRAVARGRVERLLTRLKCHFFERKKRETRDILAKIDRNGSNIGVVIT